MRMRDIDALIKATEKAINGIEQMNKKYPKKYEDAANLVCDHVITQWYDSYNPIIYDREGSLYKMYDVKVKDSKLIVDIDGEGLSGLGRYLYELTFVEGYHGGAKTGTSYYRSPQGTKLKAFSHPQPGIPYWKTPIPEFYRWGRPALRSFSPYNRIINQLNKAMSEIDEERQSEYNKYINKIKNIIQRL